MLFLLECVKFLKIFNYFRRLSLAERARQAHNKTPLEVKKNETPQNRVCLFTQKLENQYRVCFVMNDVSTNN